MGFRTGSYAKVWSIEPSSDRALKIRMSVSRKPKGSDEYVTDFSGFVFLVGDALTKGTSLKAGDRIKLGDVDVKTSFDQEKQKGYTNFYIFDYTMADETTAPAPARQASTPAAQTNPLNTPTIPPSMKKGRKTAFATAPEEKEDGDDELPF